MLVPLLLLLLAATASAATPQPWLVTKHCRHARAPRLCQIHYDRHRANHLRRRMQQRPLAYHWRAERYPERRTRIMVYWAGTLAVTRQHWHHYQAAPWPAGWLQAAMCIHRYEGSWTDTTPTYMGGMQFDAATWAANGGHGNPGMAPVAEQLRVAYATWKRRGWAPWPNTRLLCGL